MAVEIERKFLITSDAWQPLAVRSRKIMQAYLANTANSSVRVRLTDDTEARLTIKSKGPTTSREEFEYPLPMEDARSMLKLRVSSLVSKVRHFVPYEGMNWEVDIFEGDNAGLVLAEVELTCATQAFSLPDWVGEEVSNDERYSNSRLAEQPYVTFASELP